MLFPNSIFQLPLALTIFLLQFWSTFLLNFHPFSLQTVQQMSIESCFPSCWKCALVVPVFKNSGDRSGPLNYGAISLLPIISKLFESLINSALVTHLNYNSLFSDNQYGFCASRSTADILTVITEDFIMPLTLVVKPEWLLWIFLKH